MVRDLLKEMLSRIFGKLALIQVPRNHRPRLQPVVPSHTGAFGCMIKNNDEEIGQTNHRKYTSLKNITSGSKRISCTNGMKDPKNKSGLTRNAGLAILNPRKDQEEIITAKSMTSLHS
jgi:hypothetical protein